MQGPLGPPVPREAWVLTNFLPQVLQASRDWQVLLVWPGLHQTRAPQALVAHEAGRVLEVTWARLERLLRFQGQRVRRELVLQFQDPPVQQERLLRFQEPPVQQGLFLQFQDQRVKKET